MKSINYLNEKIKSEDAVLVYFSHEKCNVCKILKPKISEIITKNFPKMSMYYSDTVKMPETAGQMGIFTVPSVLIFFAGKEYFRFGRNVSINEIVQKIKRPYNMIIN